MEQERYNNISVAKSKYREAAVEVLDILDNTEKVYVDKIPKKFIKFLVDISSDDYSVNFNHIESINEMRLKKETRELLGYIYINWWCDTINKEIYLKKINEIEMQRYEKSKDKYRSDKLFENKNKLINEKLYKNSQNVPIEYQDGKLKKIINKIKKLFKRV